MGVIPDYRSQGIDAQLLNACRTWAQENGFQKLFVNSYFQNKQAISFYKKQGFSEIDVSFESPID
jgi:GNAT superfamily N-acetyltransferase